MGRLPVTAAVDIIKGAREKFNVEVETHSPCGLQGFYLTVKEPSQELTDYIVNEFKAKKAVVDVSDDQTTFVYKYYKDSIDSNFTNSHNNARPEHAAPSDLK